VNSLSKSASNFRDSQILISDISSTIIAQMFWRSFSDSAVKAACLASISAKLVWYSFLLGPLSHGEGLPHPHQSKLPFRIDLLGVNFGCKNCHIDRRRNRNQPTRTVTAISAAPVLLHAQLAVEQALHIHHRHRIRSVRDSPKQLVSHEPGSGECKKNDGDNSSRKAMSHADDLRK
jgi:hypothetical protein